MTTLSDWAALKARVAKTFLSLRGDGINAVGPVGFDQREALSKVWRPAKFRGYAFFHTQDAQSARGGSSPLWIGFGVTKDDATGAESVAVGREVAVALVRGGLFVEWDGDPTARLRVYLSTEHAEQTKALAAVEREKHNADLRALEMDRMDPVEFFGNLRVALEGLTREGAYQVSFEPLDCAERTRKAVTARKTIIVCPSEFLPTWDKICLDITTFPQPHDKTVVKRIADELRKSGFRVSYIHGSYLHLRTTK
jgi:hypothetical protein